MMIIFILISFREIEKSPEIIGLLRSVDKHRQAPLILIDDALKGSILHQALEVNMGQDLVWRGISSWLTKLVGVVLGFFAAASLS